MKSNEGVSSGSLDETSSQIHETLEGVETKSDSPLDSFDRAVSRRHVLSVLARVVGSATVGGAAFSLTGCDIANNTDNTDRRITGQVVDTEGNPLQGIAVQYGNQSTTTTSSGEYDFDFDPNAVRVKASGSGLVGHSLVVPEAPNTDPISVRPMPLFPRDLSVDGDPLPTELPALKGPIIELTEEEKRNFERRTPDFSNLRDHLRQKGLTREKPLVTLGAISGNDIAGQVLHSPDGEKQAVLINVRRGDDSRKAFSVQLDRKNEVFEFSSRKEGEFNLKFDPLLLTITSGPLEGTTIPVSSDGEPSDCVEKEFAKWLRNEESLSETTLKLILASYISLIFSPQGWAACFAILWIVGDSIERCKEHAKDECNNT